MDTPEVVDPVVVEQNDPSPPAPAKAAKNSDNVIKAADPVVDSDEQGALDRQIHSVPSSALFDDEYSGMGGEYKIDPDTGKRVPA